jgi:polysaccharide biosynthesis transport protein
LRVLRTRRGLIRAVTLLTVAATAAIMFALPTLYSTSAVVMLDQRKNNVADLSSVLSALPTDPSSVQNQIQVLSSRDLALKVIDKLKLENDPEFNPALHRGGLPDLNPLHYLRASSSVGDPAGQRDAVVNAFLNHLDVTLLGVSTSIQVSVSAEDPEKAARIANTLAKSYTDDQVAIKVQATRQAAAWLGDRMRQLADQVQQQEAAVQLYKAEHDLVESADGKSLVDEQLVAINTQAITAQSDLAEKKAAYERVAALTKTGNAADITPVVNSKMIGDLRSQEAELVRQEADLATRYGPNHPKMVAIRNQVRDLAAKVAREVQGIAGSLESDLEVARAHVGSIEASLARVERQAREDHMARVRLKALEANLASTRTTYESFITRLRAVQDQDDIQIPEARVISTAPIPAAPSSPHRALFVGASIPGGLLLGILFALLLERFGAPVRQEVPAAPQPLRRPAPKPERPVAPPAAVPAFADATPPPAPVTPPLRPAQAFAQAQPPVLPPVLAELAASPDLRLADWVLDNPGSPYGQGLTVLLGALMAMRTSQALVVSLTSLATDAGQSVAALALARVASRAGLRTLLIDGDLGRLAPGAASGGLAAVVNGAPLNGTVLKDRHSNVYCLAAPAGVWPQATGVLNSLRQSCDLVLINAPVPGAADAWPPLAALSDVVLLLAAANAPQGVVDKILRSLVAMRAPLRGLVIMR